MVQKWSKFYLFAQELAAERDEGARMIPQTVENGERLYPNTSSEGRDIIRQELRYKLIKTWIELIKLEFSCRLKFATA